MKIYAPVKSATGVWCSVHFKNGVGETNDPNLIEWFKEHGYRLEESLRVEQAATVQEDILNSLVEDVGEVNQPDFESMTPAELREWAKDNGLSSKIKNIRNKEKLLEIIRG